MQIVANIAAQPDSIQAHQYSRGGIMVDERYVITEAEREKVLKTISEGRITLPSKEKRKIIILQYIIGKFDPETEICQKKSMKLQRYD